MFDLETLKKINEDPEYAKKAGVVHIYDTEDEREAKAESRRASIARLFVALQHDTITTGGQLLDATAKPWRFIAVESGQFDDLYIMEFRSLQSAQREYDSRSGTKYPMRLTIHDLDTGEAFIPEWRLTAFVKAVR